MPLFLCCVLLIVPASTSHLLSDTASVEQAHSIEVIVVNGMFLQSCTIKYWAKFVIDSILLIDTVFVLFQSFRGRYTGLIVPQDLFWKRVFQTSFLCQIVVQSLGKIFFWQSPFSFALRFGKHMQVAYTWTGSSLHGFPELGRMFPAWVDVWCCTCIPNNPKEDGEIKEADTDPFQVKSDLSNVRDPSFRAL